MEELVVGIWEEIRDLVAPSRRQKIALAIVEVCESHDAADELEGSILWEDAYPSDDDDEEDDSELDSDEDY